MSWKIKFSGIAINLILCTAFFASEGISQPLGESFISNDPIEITEPKTLKTTEPQSIGVSSIKPLKATKPGLQKAVPPRSLIRGDFKEGEYTAAKRENTAYRRCAKLEKFDELLNCAQQVLNGKSE